MENNEMYVGLSHCSYNLLIARSIQLENGGSLTECENFIGSWWNEIGGTKLNKMKLIRWNKLIKRNKLIKWKKFIKWNT